MENIEAAMPLILVRTTGRRVAMAGAARAGVIAVEPGKK